MFRQQTSPSTQRTRTRGIVSAGALLVASGFVLATLLNPAASSFAEQEDLPTMGLPAQAMTEVAGDGFAYEVEEIGVESPTPTPSETETTDSDSDSSGDSQNNVPRADAPDPGSAQAIARDLLAAKGWGDDEYACLYNLWMRESNWNVYAQNPSSGAYGIPQSLPGSKMASAGSDWQTNPETQIRWGIGYIEGRYGTPCGAWAHSEAVGWY
ncbi:lytic transglycosylase domain-containing protein [uncultured Agrococcus sp.]|uniref:aggregation-promoting factor C-terminal-like domain-containing protein n=1 Tax=uncultured Agrococcus sp. TaxID=382258 RepID=UPI0025DCA640|nr:lytic transglycosylase domain-containing protein [uncultured Agrococcus sp.]